jgi:hypothetical protein
LGFKGIRGSLAWLRAKIAGASFTMLVLENPKFLQNFRAKYFHEISAIASQKKKPLFI